MITVKYDKVIGYAIIENNGKKFKISLCEANCLWAEMYFYKDADGNEMAQLYAFVNDVQHLKRIIKNIGLDKYKSFTFIRKNICDAQFDDIMKAVCVISKNTKIAITIK